MKNYYIASHIAYNRMGKENYGPSHHIYDFLVKNKKNAYFIKHCLHGKKDSYIFSKDKKKKKRIFFRKNYLSRYISEIIINLLEVKKYNNWFIGVDPINGLCGVFLKKIGRTKKFIYYTVDFTEIRFSNKILNFTYLLLDRICISHADELWSVSSRIVEKRIEQGIDKSKVLLVPNSPDLSMVPIRKVKKNNDLIIVSQLSRSLHLKSTLEALKLLLKKKRDLRLLVVGSGDQEENFKQLVKKMNLSKKVVFTGPIEYEKIFELIQESLIGIALYSNKNSFNKYGDSMKAREYLACGIPVIINTIPSTANEIKNHNAGLVIDGKESTYSNKMYDFISRCLDESAFYNLLSKNASALANKYDKKKLLIKLFNL